MPEQPEDAAGLVRGLVEATRNIEQHIHDRAKEIAEPAINAAREDALERVERAASAHDREMQRFDSLITELRRQIGAQERRAQRAEAQVRNLGDGHAPGNVYLVMVHDRHIEPAAYPFSTAQAAIEFAKAYADGHRNGGTVREQHIDGWLYCASYNAEEDSVWVIERAIDQAEDVPW